jgi:hypothetical protein
MKVSDYYNTIGKPIKCYFCGSTDFQEKIIDRLETLGPVLEYEVHCKCCEGVIGHWGCGYWSHDFKTDCAELISRLNTKDIVARLDDDVKVFTAYGKKEDYFEYGA